MGTEKTEKKSILTLPDVYDYLDERLWLPKYNVITRTIELSPTARQEMRLYTSPDRELQNFIVALTDELRQLYNKVNIDTVTQYLYYIATTDISKDRNGWSLAYNPVEYGINSMSERYTDTPDKLPELYELMHIPEEDTLSRTLIHKWLLQALAIQKNGYIYNGKKRVFGLDGVLVLNGAQGIGKSRLAAALAAPFNNYTQTPLFGSGSIKLEQKDSIIKATRKWIYEIGEIEYSFKKSDLSDFKQFITQDTDEYRAPYGQKSESYYRHTSFIASCNTTDYLSDTTGNRRFWTIPLSEKFDFEKLDNFDFGALWVQIAIELERSDLQCFRLSTEEQNALALRNGDFLAKAPAQQEIEDIYTSVIANPDMYEYRYTTVTAFAAEHTELAKYNSRTIGKALRIALEQAGEEYQTKNIRPKDRSAPFKAVLLPMRKKQNIQVVARSSGSNPYELVSDMTS